MGLTRLLEQPIKIDADINATSASKITAEIFLDIYFFLSELNILIRPLFSHQIFFPFIKNRQFSDVRTSPCRRSPKQKDPDWGPFAYRIRISIIIR